MARPREEKEAFVYGVVVGVVGLGVLCLLISAGIAVCRA
jgi:hypothetical protein